MILHQGMVLLSVEVSLEPLVRKKMWRGLSGAKTDLVQFLFVVGFTGCWHLQVDISEFLGATWNNCAYQIFKHPFCP